MEKIAVDIETSDPHLQKMGAGTINGSGRILGVGVYTTGWQKYFTKPTMQYWNMMKDKNSVKIFHNGVYDMDYLVNTNSPLAVGMKACDGRIEDTMTREALLAPLSPSLSLDACCAAHNIEGKHKKGIEAHWKGAGKAVKHLEGMLPEVVAEYCLQDCKATYQLYQMQEALISEQGLDGINDVECSLYPLLMMMRRNGVCIDTDAMQKLKETIASQYEAGMKALMKKYGIADLSLSSASHLERIFSKEGLPIAKTQKGNPSFTGAVLDKLKHPVVDEIKRLRRDAKLLSTYLEAWPQMLVNGRLHCSLFPAKRDDGGAVTGRWSSSHPNLQQVPARGDKHGEAFRSLFLPDAGCLLGAFDYKQIEYRVFLHYASGQDAEAVRKEFNKGHEIDYHQMTIDMLGWGYMGKEGRHLAKGLNFGMLYGMGYRTFAKNYAKILGTSSESEAIAKASALFREYYTKVPFVKPTVDDIQRTAVRRGYVKTVLGRRQHVQSGQAFKIVNYLVQGTAADIMKKAMVDAYKAGVFNVLKLHFPVHDELVFSIPQTKAGVDACEELRHIMETAVPLRVPLGVDTEIGEDWGHCTNDNYSKLKSRLNG